MAHQANSPRLAGQHAESNADLDSELSEQRLSHFRVVGTSGIRTELSIGSRAARGTNIESFMPSRPATNARRLSKCLALRAALGSIVSPQGASTRISCLPMRLTMSDILMISGRFLGNNRRRLDPPDH